MEANSQEEWVKKLETKLGELREQRIKVDEANEILRKKLQTLTAHLDDLDVKYGKKGSDDDENDKADAKKTQVSVGEEKPAECELKEPTDSESLNNPEKE